ncbi:MAG: hypothetical protein HDS88_04930 [Bacteroidales bacterium]|nr:hypothetical protein [Bacteroidales bacterium]
MEQPYRVNTLIVKSVGMLPGASAEYISLSMTVQHTKEANLIRLGACRTGTPTLRTYAAAKRKRAG